MKQKRKTVVGLFDNEKDAARTIGRLQQQGFGQNHSQIKVIDQSCLSLESRDDTPDRHVENQSSNQNRGVVIDPATKTTVAPIVVERAAEDALLELGVATEEAPLCAKHVAQGGLLVIVQTDQTHAQNALNTLQQTSTEASIS